MRTLLRAVATAAAVLSATAAFAQQYPDRPITLVVGFAAGSNSDIVSRFVGKIFAEKIGGPVVIENKPGAGGMIAAEFVARAKPDGYTLFAGSSGPLGTHKFLYKNLPYDALTSFTYIHGFTSTPMILVVPAASPFKTLDELVRFAKANPDKLNYGSLGPGSGNQLAAELMRMHTSIKITHIPYKGNVAATTDLMAGTVDLLFESPLPLKALIQAGKLRALASTGSIRLPSFPNVPTFAELGYPGVLYTGWLTLVGPAGLPQDVVDRIMTAFGAALQDPASVAFANEQALTPMTQLKGSGLHEFVRTEQQKFGQVVKAIGLQPN